MAFLSEVPIDSVLLHARVLEARRGALASFLGVVRDHHGGRPVIELEYFAYGPMAEAECAAIVSETEAKWPVTVALAHRVGRLAIGEVAVAIVVAADRGSQTYSSFGMQ